MLSATTLTATVSTRLRDASNQMHSAATVRSVLTDAQRMVNAEREEIIASAAQAVGANVNFIAIFANVTAAMRLVGVREGVRNLTRMDWRQLLQLDLTTRSDEFQGWSVIGRDLLALWPAKKVASSVTLFYVKLTDAFAAGATLSELDDESLPEVVTLTEASLLLRQRDVEDAVKLLGVEPNG